MADKEDRLPKLSLTHGWNAKQLERRAPVEGETTRTDRRASLHILAVWSVTVYRAMSEKPLVFATSVVADGQGVMQQPHGSVSAPEAGK